MAFCLLKSEVTAFKKALRDGTIDPVKMSQMTSDSRREFLAKYVGKENAKETNALFESKLLLKNQKAGYIAWAKKVSGITPPVKRDLISKIERLEVVLNPEDEKLFLKDLASTRLGVEITQEEAKAVADLSKQMQDARNKAKEDFTFPTEDDRLKYGAVKVELEDYMNNLKLKGKKTTIKERLLEIPGVLKSAVASLDNSFWGRQGVKTLLDVRTAHIWTKNFLKSWGDIGKELAGKDAMFAIKADIYSRPNALNGKYRVGRYGLDVFSEEAYPSSLPARIPLLGRIYKASESAYNGGALRLRADLADRLIKIAEKQGINTLNKDEAEGMGHLIGSLTGRGSLGKAETISKELNVLFFSVKFLRANFDTLTAHQFDAKATRFAKKEAAKNLLSIAVSVAAILTLAKTIDPESVDEDPRSTNFGKIKIFGRWTDITGGMASLIVLASRIVPTVHEGRWSFWSKSSTGKYTDLWSGEYGQRNALDVFESFFEGKLSPAAGIVRDMWKGENFEGDPFTIGGAAKQAVTPIGVQSFEKMLKDPKSSFVLGSVILDGLGLSGSSQYQQKSDWADKPTKSQEAFLKKVGRVKFNKANEEYNAEYNKWYESITKSEAYKKLSDEDKESLATRAKNNLQNKVFKKYGFKYKQQKKSKAELNEENKLLPK